MKLYGAFHTYESAAFLLRPVEEGDAPDLLEVYGDKTALPFFNSDNCDGDNFYYPTLERVAEDFYLPAPPGRGGIYLESRALVTVSDISILPSSLFKNGS